jgi:integrase
LPRTLRDSNLGTREARLRLKVRGKPYWRLLEPGRHLGYRRLANQSGTWCLRRYAGSQSYVIESLKAVADDYGSADGVTVMTFAQAQRAALDRKPKPAGPLTVRQAVEDYLEFLEHHRKSADDARVRAEALILPQLGDIAVAELTTERLRKWLNHLAATPRRLRAPKGRVRHDAPSSDPDVQRRRRVTANRVLTTLRAALSRAFREGKVPSDSAWRRVEPFRGTDQARLRFLSAEECTRLVNAAQGDFRRLVQAALWTGCRFGELANLVASDFHADSGTLLIRTSKAGKPRRVWLNIEAQQSFARWCLGRNGSDLLLPRDDGLPWGRGQQQEPMRAACAAARIVPPIPFHALRHTHASHLAMRGTPLAVIAEQLGHRDLRMTSRYSHLAKSYVGDTIRANALTLGVEPDDSVVPLAVRP